MAETRDQRGKLPLSIGVRLGLPCCSSGRWTKNVVVVGRLCCLLNPRPPDRTKRQIPLQPGGPLLRPINAGATGSRQARGGGALIMGMVGCCTASLLLDATL
ncbi:hypothetical protein NDU88_005913 [Pleurodeles waltl]|uniref:Uncharacterized protein n=1 Tax=Pleurodeles waltl TaxID=8319 RepID=A0AAV7MY30_PLEWA|nr:hypothetical protein NDU88_005913 [Pleurodeles waltl]